MYGNGKTIQIRMNKVLKAVATLDSTCNLYSLGTTIKMALAAATTKNAATTEYFAIWHQRLGHLPSFSLAKLHVVVEHSEVLSATATNEDCKHCLLDKFRKLPTTSPGSKTHTLLELTYSDLSGKFSVQARGGLQYYVTFMEDFTWYSHLYLIDTKDGALAICGIRGDPTRQEGKSTSLRQRRIVHEQSLRGVPDVQRDQSSTNCPILPLIQWSVRTAQQNPLSYDKSVSPLLQPLQKPVGRSSQHGSICQKPTTSLRPLNHTR